jgi:hypothetical protein
MVDYTAAFGPLKKEAYYHGEISRELRDEREKAIFGKSLRALINNQFLFYFSELVGCARDLIENFPFNFHSKTAIVYGFKFPL